MRPALLLAIAATVSLSAAPPRVVKTIPENGDTNVDPNTKELRVIFDQPMSRGGMSVVGGGPKFPKLIGKARWEDDRTFVWSWQLTPEHEYWLSINNQRFTNFRGTNGEPAVPYPVSFRTAKADANTGTDLSILPRHRDAFHHLQRAILEDYSHHDLHAVDWQKRFSEFRSRLESPASPRQFAQLAAELLAPAKDLHLWLKVGEENIYTHQRRAPWNVDLSLLPRVIPQWRRYNSAVSGGLFDDGTRYLFIRSWPNDASQLDPAFDIIAATAKSGRPLIIDVRANGGGSETAARQIAGCFVQKPVPYSRHMTRSAGKFGPAHTRELPPNQSRPPFTNRVAVLAGQGTVSSSESFVMMMKQSPRCQVIGEHTAGSSGNPIPVDLGNGVVAFVPSWKDIGLDGTPLEGRGVAPHIEIKNTEFTDSDPLIDAALKLLKNPD